MTIARIPLKRHGMRARTTLRQALSDSQLLGSVLEGDSWQPWRVLLIAAMGEALTEDERIIFQQLTGREREPGKRVDEFVGVIGRRGGKSRAISVVASYLAALTTHRLSPGERGVVLIVAPDLRQSAVCLDYVEAVFRQSPILRQLIEARTQRALKLTNHIDIECRPSDFRTIRGLTFIAGIADELAFFMSENSASPDFEVLNSIRPGLSTTGGPLFLISSPYARRGVLWDAYDKHYGPTGDPQILVAQAASRIMNATLPQSVVDRAMERDPALFQTIYLDVLSKRKNRRVLSTALDAIDGYLQEHYQAHLKPLLAYLKKQGRVVPLSEIGDHFAFSQMHPWHLESACEWLERKGLLQKVSVPFKLTKRSTERVEEPAYFLDM